METAAEAAVGACDDILAADQVGEAQNTLRYQLRMFDDVGGVTDNPGDEYLAFREFYVLPHAPLVFVTDIGGLDQVGTGAYLEKQADDILERKIRRVRSMPSTPADMVTHALLWNVRQRMVERLDSRGGELSVLPGIGRRIFHIVASDKLRIVDLQQESGVDDGFVFSLHGVGNREKESFFARIILVDPPGNNRAGRDSRDECLLGFYSGAGALQVFYVRLDCGLSRVQNRRIANYVGPA